MKRSMVESQIFFLAISKCGQEIVLSSWIANVSYDGSESEKSHAPRSFSLEPSMKNPAMDSNTGALFCVGQDRHHKLI